MLRWLTAGESHGPALSAIIEGIPAHVLVSSKEIDADLSRRRLGFGRGARQNFEADKITITGGLRYTYNLLKSDFGNQSFYPFPFQTATQKKRLIFSTRL